MTTQAPVTTKAPVATQAPVTTKTPVTTQAPVTTAEPVLKSKTYNLETDRSKVKILGRYAITDGGIALDLSACGIEFTAECEGDVKLKIHATSNESYYAVYVDGVRQSNRPHVGKNATATVTLVSGLPRGVHTVRVVNLGTNDSGSGNYANTKESFESGMRSFISTARSKYKKADLPIVFVYDMMRDGYQDVILNVVNDLGGADAHLYIYKGVRNNSRAGGHPNASAQKKTGVQAGRNTTLPRLREMPALSSKASSSISPSARQENAAPKLAEDKQTAKEGSIIGKEIVKILNGR